MLLSALNNIYNVYYVFVALIYGCIATLCIMALVFGLRATRHVKKESITSLPDGLSPLDIQRIFIGKTYPQRLTKALLAYWAKCGYIKLEYVDKTHVNIIKLKDMPTHRNSAAVFFDRGTYVRERELFMWLMRNNVKPINLNKPLFRRDAVSRIDGMFAVREDEGVYSSKHYTLKVLTLVISIIPFALCAVWAGISFGNYVSLILVGTAVIGIFVLKFAQTMPILFKLIWCGLWLGASVGVMIGYYVSAANDPFGIIYAAVALLFGGPFVLIRFVDYREKNNLDDYSNIVNYRKFLLRAPASELHKLDYLTVLPYLYAYKIHWLTARKFDRVLPPEAYSGDTENKGALL